jgi:hypothetical protein
LFGAQIGIRALTISVGALALHENAVADAVTSRLRDAAYPILALERASRWTATDPPDGPSPYMQQLVKDLLGPAMAATAVERAVPATGGGLSARIVTALLEALLAHLLDACARISPQGAQRLQADVAYMGNFLATHPSAQPGGAALAQLPVFERAARVLQFLLPVRLSMSEVESAGVVLPDAAQWLSCRARSERTFGFC